LLINTNPGKDKYGILQSDDAGTKVGGAEGVEDRCQNRLVEGYKYFRSLPPEKQQKLRNAAKASGWDLNTRD